MMWTEYRGRRAENIAAAWLAMHDANTALAAVFRDTSGRYLLVYKVAGSITPTVEKFFRSLKAAQARAALVIEQKLIVPRRVLLDVHM